MIVTGCDDSDCHGFEGGVRRYVVVLVSVFVGGTRRRVRRRESKKL